MTTLRPGTPEEAGMSPERVENLRRLGAKWVEDGTHPALVLLVARRGIIVLHEAWGKQGPEPDAPALRTDAIFPVASLGKMLTATCAMMLVEDGLLGLNRPVHEYVPEFAGEGKQDVLVHHLLTHTAGLADEEIGPPIRERMMPLVQAAASGEAIPPATDATQHPYVGKLVEAINAAPLSRPPGEAMSYSNLGYVLVGEVVRRASGRSLVDFSRERLFEPLGMRDTTFLISESYRPRMVRRPPDALFAGMMATAVGRIPLATAAATSTALDMVVLGQTFLDGGHYGDTRILSPAGVREMTRNQIPGVGTSFLGEYHAEASWGYGWGVHGYEKWRQRASLLSPETFSHSGGSGTVLWVDPVNELVLAYFSVLVSARNRHDRDENDDLFANAAVAAIDD
jgi:CubicO group peptidase (beta-lactamase class C family)